MRSVTHSPLTAYPRPMPRRLSAPRARREELLLAIDEETQRNAQRHKEVSEGSQQGCG